MKVLTSNLFLKAQVLIMTKVMREILSRKNVHWNWKI